MSNISSQILEAMDIVVNEKISNLKFDKTVEVTIKKIKDLTVGEYLAEYNGNIISVFSRDLKQSYKVGERVFIKIPEGDLSNKKFIENVSGEKGLTNSEITELQTSFIGIEPSLDVLYGQNIQKNEYGVIAGNGIKGDELKSSIQIFDHDIQGNEENDLTFQQYALSYKFLKISANFKTLFQSNFFEGNYGIEVIFLLDDEQTPEVKYTLDINSFNGNPYKFQAYNTQFIVFPVPKGKLKGLKSIRFFEEFKDYDKRKVQIFNKDTDKIEEKITDISDKENIFVKDIKIQFAEQVDFTNNLYFLQIQAPSGNIFEKNVPLTNTLYLEGRLIYKNQSILTEENSVCKWYKRDPSINIGDELYDKDAGPGWRAINAKGYSDPEKVSFNILEVKKQDVLFENKYKLIIVYNKKIILSKEASIIRKTSDFDISIEKIIEGKSHRLKLKNNKLNDSNKYVGDWSVSLPGGRYEKFGIQVDSVEINEYLVFDNLTFTCDIYYKPSNQDNFLGPIMTKEYIIAEKDDDQNFLQVDYSGSTIFKYDANGDIGIEEFELQKNLECRILNQGELTYGTDWIIEWSIENKTIPLGSGAEIITTNSMLTNLWVDTNGKLYYNIKQKYKNNCDNTLDVKITFLLTGKEYFFRKEIIFLKDGDQGTNGTTYLTVIKPSTANGLEINEYSPLVYNNTWNAIRLKAFVYKDGNILTDNIIYEWDAGKDLKIIGSRNADIIQITGNGNPGTDKYQYYVKLKITITDKEESAIIYSFYPIDVLVKNGTIDLDPRNITIEIPSYIQYNSNGERPKFNYSNFKFIVNNQDQSKSLENFNNSNESEKRFESFNPSLVTAHCDLIEKNYKLFATPKFLFEDNLIGAFKCKINNSSNTGYNTENYIIHPIMMYLNTYGNEPINGWDGTKLDIDGKGQYILAPQVGAGIKNKDNTFTGVVMGKDTSQQLVGLYGYDKGIASFGFKADGTAFIGKSKKGQILFNQVDGNEKAIIQSGNYEVNQTGIYMDLTNGILKMASPKDAYIANGKITFDTTNKKTPLKIGIDGSIKFSVDWDGTLHATGVDISGKIEANQGAIGGWIITENTLQSKTGNTTLNSDGSISVANGRFNVDPQGNLILNGNITWGTDSVPVKYQFSQYNTSDDRYWHDIMYPNDKYRRDSLDGGKTYGTPYQFRGEDGLPGRPGEDASVTRENIYRAMLQSYSTDGIYSYNGDILINASAIKAGTLDVGKIFLENQYGGFTGGLGIDNNGRYTYGAKMYGSDKNYYIIATNAGVRMQAPGHELTVTQYGIFADGVSISGGGSGGVAVFG